MPKVLFVYHNAFEEGYMPLAIASLAGMMKENGVEAKLFDTSFWRDINSDITESNREVREKLGGYKKVEGFNPQRELVDIKQKFRETVMEFKPDLIAATSTSHEFNSLVEFIEPTKKEFNIPVILGGSHPTSVPEKVLKKEGVDIVCIGEGENPLLELVRRMERGADITTISSLWVKTLGGEIVKNQVRRQSDNLDDLPEPDWDILDKRHRVRPFEGELKQYGFFESSRGCPHNCSYCLNATLHKLDTEGGKSFKVRYHSPKEVVRRVKKYKEKYGFNHIQFIDENLASMSLDKLKEFAELYKKEIGVNFFTQCRPEAFYGTPEKAKIMADMGCVMIGMGAESADEELCRRVLNRPMKTEILEKSVKILKEAGILLAAYYIIGFPTETKEMIQKTIELHRRIKPYRQSVRFLHPYPGTPIRELCVKGGYFDDDYEDKAVFQSYFIEPILNLPSPPHPTKEELIELRNEFSVRDW